jgi:hypothetical protein
MDKIPEEMAGTVVRAMYKIPEEMAGTVVKRVPWIKYQERWLAVW